MTVSGGIKHLKSQGSTLYKHNTTQHLMLVENKPNIHPIPNNRIVEAYGVLNCQMLIKNLKEGDIIVKKKVLKALSSMLKLPQDLSICLKLGVLELIEDGIVQNDVETHELFCLVLSIIAESSISKLAILQGNTIERILPVFSSTSSITVSQLLYDTLINISQSFVGARALSSNGYLTVIVSHLKLELNEDSRLRAIKLLKNVINDGIEATVCRAVDLDSVELCASHLYDSNYLIRVAACETLGALCFIERARKVAAEKGIVKKLCNLLTDNHWQVSAASSGVLMSLCIYDEAKKEVFAAGGLHTVNQLLQSSKYLVQLNAVKLVTVMAAYPPARRSLNISSTEYHLRNITQDKDQLLARSAKTALHSVQWKP
jgi:hypothetical protein